MLHFINYIDLYFDILEQLCAIISILFQNLIYPHQYSSKSWHNAFLLMGKDMIFLFLGDAEKDKLGKLGQIHSQTETMAAYLSHIIT
jgi:hypothetical protein